MQGTQDQERNGKIMFRYVPPKITLNSNIAVSQDRNTIIQESLTNTDFFQDNKNHFIASTLIDNGGCAYYRIRFISSLLEQRYGNCHPVDSRRLYPLDILQTIESLRVQRLNSPNNLPWLRQAVMKVKRERNPFRLIYDTDDVLVLQDIPLYNCYRDCLKDTEKAIPYFMEASDIITVTCKNLADYYEKKYSINPEKFKIIQNYLPRFFFDHFHPLEIRARFDSLKKRKPRICFSCSGSHFDVMSRNHDVDDFSGIAQWIIDNRKRYEFIFQGGISPLFLKYGSDFKRLRYTDFLSYPLSRREIDADLYIQPLQKSAFNECKSTIKLLEAWAEGVPAFVQDITNYKQVAPEACFSDAESLDRMVTRLFNMSTDEYLQLVTDNYRKMDAHWLENNLDKWIPVIIKF